MKRFLAPILALALCASLSGAATWYVEKDGSGDFLLIQDAVDAAASGDTIQIGPGRYDDLRIRGSMSSTSVAYWEDGRDLAFIGTGVDEVIIGPTSYEPDGAGPQGLHQHTGADIHVESITFENLQVGVASGQGSFFYAEGLRFETGVWGMFVQFDYIIYTTTYTEAYSPTIDMGSNYWFADGTPGRLDDLILDGNDDPSLNIIVNYDPIRTEPVPTEKKSFGGLKALFR